MQRLPEDIRQLILLLIEHDVDFAICGGHAVAYHGHPRMTMDIDLLVLPSDGNAAKIMKALDAFGFGDAGIPHDAFTKEGTAITLGAQPNQVDLVTSMSKTPTRQVIENSVWGALAGLKIRYVGRADLIEAKRQAGRPKDLADLDELEKKGTGN